MREATHLTVRFGKHHFQLTAACSGQVIDFIGAGADIGGIDRVAVLQDFQLRPTQRHAANNRGVTLQNVGAHFLIGFDQCAFDRYAAKNITAGVRFAEGQV